MRTGLTTRGWNNVLIFASLFMIILFNSTHKMLMDESEETNLQVLVAPQWIIQTIDFSGLKFERIGASWRTVTSLVDAKVTNVASYVKNWQNQRISVLSSRPDMNQQSIHFPIVVYILGSEQGTMVFEVFIEQDNGLVYMQNKMTQNWFAMTLQELSQLVPSVLLPARTEGN